MATNLIEEVQTSLGLPPLQKIDPNLQEAKDNRQRSPDEKLAQAAVPAIVAGIYRLTRTDEGASTVQGGKTFDSWLSTIFGDRRAEVVEKVAHYSGSTRETSEQMLEKVGAETIRIMRKDDQSYRHDPKLLREYMSVQRHNALVYLPAAMQLGELLNDNTMDDRTNKMEGPVSNLMHKIEGAMSRGES